MKKIAVILLGLAIFINLAVAEDIVWTEQSNDQLPVGVKLFKGTRTSPQLQAFYLDIDMNNPDLAIRPYISAQSMTVPAFVVQTGAYVAVNGGFFGGNSSLSSVIYPDEIRAINVKSVTRNNLSYPLLRSLFSIDKAGKFSVDWIYHFSSAADGLYSFVQPYAYEYLDPTPKSAPQQEDGQLFDSVLVGIGGAPTLVKNSQVEVTYNQEIMWGSGVGYDNGDPRTAVGYTAENHVIMVTADGRQSGISEGVGLPELAQIMIDIGCVEAMNLDGGGSTQMATASGYVNSPSEQRAVPTILAVVHKDSLNLPEQAVIEKVIDTGDDACEQIGAGWFATANAGFWGSTPSLLHARGDGVNMVKFSPEISTRAAYKVYAWWVAASNRCTNTPFIIHYHNGVDTVYMDQTGGGSAWNLVGEYIFKGDASEAVFISDAATAGTYVVADAIRLVTYDTSGVSAFTPVAEIQPMELELAQNYPNPFNPTTYINFSIIKKQHVRLTVYDISGQEVARLADGIRNSGAYTIEFNATGLASGVYFCRLEAGTQIRTKKMLLTK